VAGTRRAPAERDARDPGAGLPLSDADFVRFQTLINEEAGIWLAPVKKALVVGRLALQRVARRDHRDLHRSPIGIRPFVMWRGVQ